ncbi:MAG: hypothetical protein COB66_02650 [Coxiella sp. (in: Bacteria)]|nr:MAG: hypothetical protein COB66_02650 [Coxiella sp. (in: g-proteobacteria)]
MRNNVVISMRQLYDDVEELVMKKASVERDILSRALLVLNAVESGFNLFFAFYWSGGRSCWVLRHKHLVHEAITQKDPLLLSILMHSARPGLKTAIGYEGEDSSPRDLIARLKANAITQPVDTRRDALIAAFESPIPLAQIKEEILKGQEIAASTRAGEADTLKLKQIAETILKEMSVMTSCFYMKYAFIYELNNKLSTETNPSTQIQIVAKMMVLAKTPRGLYKKICAIKESDMKFDFTIIGEQNVMLYNTEKAEDSYKTQSGLRLFKLLERNPGFSCLNDRDVQSSTRNAPPAYISTPGSLTGQEVLPKALDLLKYSQALSAKFS